jgi:hypothetical protein
LIRSSNIVTSDIRFPKIQPGNVPRNLGFCVLFYEVISLEGRVVGNFIGIGSRRNAVARVLNSIRTSGEEIPL